MDEGTRADPDALLASIKKDERGKLTVFLGPAAGVGKTYAMLEAARERLDKGVDVVAGWVETHGRAETEALLEGIPILPPRSLEYRGKLFAEMDLDSLLARKPSLALVDELAHTNITGLRNSKRYQDVEELLGAGIDVYTTLNVQHFESLNDIVSRITGITVRETVPDSVLEEAEIQLIDIPPEDLMQRLRDGKVYVSDQAEEALHKFFRPGNINALREMTLRYTAQRVDQQLETYMKAHGIAGPWPAGDRVMVCISSSPFATRLIRNGSRMAARLQAEWIAVYVETSDRVMPDKVRERLQKNLRLAEDLGAETVTLSGDDPVDELLALAHKRNVTQLIIGQPLRFRFSEWLFGSLVDKVIRRSEGISVHVIPGRPEWPGRQPSVLVSRPGPSAASLLRVLGIIVLVTVLGRIFMPSLGLVNIAMFYLLPVLLSAINWGPKLAAITALAVFLFFDFLFVPPTFSLTVLDLRYLFTLAIYLLVAGLTGSLSARLHHQVRQARQREDRMTALYSLSREISGANDLEPILTSVAREVAESIEGQVVIMLPDKGDKLAIRATTPDAAADFAVEKEIAVATWVFEHGQIAGQGTDTLGGAKGVYAPLKTQQNTIGVLGVQPRFSERYLSAEQRHLLEAFASLIAIAVNRIELAEQARHAQLLIESERLHNALFNSISHDLRTPLTSITGAVTSLLDDAEIYGPEARGDLLQTIKLGASRMERLVNNLLDMARLESGVLKLRKDWCDIQDIIGVAVSRCDGLRGRTLKIDVEPGLPLVPVDFVLIEQVLVNILDNAIKYSPPEQDLKIHARRVEKMLEVSVTDHGPGIPEGDLERIFDKFYRLQASSQVTGTGLGLAICRAIVEAHDGCIWAANHRQGGAVITFRVPQGERAPGQYPETNRISGIEPATEGETSNAKQGEQNE